MVFFSQLLPAPPLTGGGWEGAGPFFYNIYIMKRNATAQQRFSITVRDVGAKAIACVRKPQSDISVTAAVLAFAGTVTLSTLAVAKSARIA